MRAGAQSAERFSHPRTDVDLRVDRWCKMDIFDCEIFHKVSLVLMEGCDEQVGSESAPADLCQRSDLKLSSNSGVFRDLPSFVKGEKGEKEEKSAGQNSTSGS